MHHPTPLPFVLALVAAVACGPPAAGPDPVAPAPATPDDGIRWRPVENEAYGIRLLLPNPGRCVTRELGEGEIGHLECRYPGGMAVDVIGFGRAMSREELRRAAADLYHGVPTSAWSWRPMDAARNGYAFAEEWRGDEPDRHVLGLIGRSARRPVSHVVFIAGPDAEWEARRAAIDRFVENIHAL